MARAIILIALLSLAGCTIQRAIEADRAQHQMVGMSKQNVLACMGPPAGRQAEGATEVWAYPSGGRTNTFATAQTYGSGVGTYNGYSTGGVTTGTYAGSGASTSYGFGTSVNRYCVVNIVFSGDNVAVVNYQGNTGGLLTQGEECAYAVQNCLGQTPTAQTAVAPPAPAASTSVVTAAAPEPTTLADSQAENKIYRACVVQASMGTTPAELDANCSCLAHAEEPGLETTKRDEIASGKIRPDELNLSDEDSVIMAEAIMTQCEGVRRTVRPFLEQQIQKDCGGTQPYQIKNCRDGRAFLQKIGD